MATSNDICRGGPNYDCLGISLGRVPKDSTGSTSGGCKRRCSTYRVYDEGRGPTKIMCIARRKGECRGLRSYDKLGHSMELMGTSSISRVKTYDEYN